MSDQLSARFIGALMGLAGVVTVFPAYGIVPGFDVVTHALGAFALYLYARTWMSHRPAAVGVYLLSIGWEAVEWLFRVEVGVYVIISTGDTIGDLIVNALGIALATLAYRQLADSHEPDIETEVPA